MLPPPRDPSRPIRPTFSGLKPLRPVAAEVPGRPAAMPAEKNARPVRPAAASVSGAWLTMLMACLLVFNHFGRPFEKVLIGYRIPFVLCMLAVIILILQRKVSGFTTRIGLVLTAFMGWMVLVTPLSSWRGGSLSYVGWYLALNGVIVLIVAATNESRLGIRKVFYIAAFSCLFHIVFGGRFEADRLNLSGTYGNADDVALLAGFAIPFVLFSALQLPHMLLRITIGVPATAFCLYCIGLTATRAAVVALLGLGAVYFWRVGPIQRLVIVLLSIFALGGSLIVLPSSVLERFGTITQSFDVEAARQMSTESEAMASVSERFDLLMDGVHMTLTHPIWGVGPGQYPYYRFQNLRQPNGRPKIWFPSHNTYIQISSESGIPGLLLYLGFLAMIYKTIRKCYAYNKRNSHPNWQIGYQMTICLEAAFVYFVICAIFMTCDQHPHQFLLAGLAIATERVSLAAMKENETAPAAAKPAPAAGFGPLGKPRFAV